MIPRGLPPVLGLFCALASVAGTLLGVAPAAAEYRNPRLLGLRPWEPAYLRDDEPLVGLNRPPRGYLQGTRKVREEFDVDLETGRITIRRMYGDTILGPEYVGSLDSTTRAAAALSATRLRRR